MAKLEIFYTYGYVLNEDPQVGYPWPSKRVWAWNESTVNYTSYIIIIIKLKNIYISLGSLQHARSHEFPHSYLEILESFQKKKRQDKEIQY